MKFLCDKYRLDDALSPILPIIPSKKEPKAALTSVWISAAEDSLVLRGTNMNISMESHLESVKVEEPGVCLVIAKPLAGLLREITDPTVHLELHEGKLRIPTSSGQFEVVTDEVAEFPELSFESEGSVVQVPVEQLNLLYQSTEFACANEATKYAMNGILVQVKDQTLSFAATDGRRLAVHSYPLDVAPNIEVEALLPRRSFGMTIKALLSFAGSSAGVSRKEGPTEKENPENKEMPGEKGGDLVCISFNEQSVLFSLPGGKISMQKILGSFPNFHDVIPKDIATTVEFQSGLLESNLRRAAVLTDPENPAIKMTMEGSRCRVESSYAGLGSADTSFEATVSGPGGSVTFNPSFLFDALRVAQANPIRFEFKDGDTPGKFCLGEQLIYVVMPITGIK